MPSLRALVRQWFTRRHLLQWTTAAVSQAAAKHGLRALARQHALTSGGVAGHAAGAGGSAALRTACEPAVGVALGALWALTPLWMWLGSRRIAASVERLSDEDRELVCALAVDTWRYYERHVTAADHYLPPDNLQAIRARWWRTAPRRPISACTCWRRSRRGTSA